MFRWLGRSFVGAVVLACVCGGAASAQRQGDFRVETEIFAENAKQPLAENLTLFRGGVVYDFMLAPSKEITILDLRHGVFVLLDPSRRVKTTWSTQKLMQFIASLETRARENKKLAYLISPQFKEEFDEDQHNLVLSNDRIIYKVSGMKPKDAGFARRYRLFSDWSARLNAARPGNLPPHSRLALNRRLSELGLAPLEVEKTLIPQSVFKREPVIFRSRQLFTWRLLGKDPQRIEQANDQAAQFKEVGVEEYLELEKRIASQK